MIIYLRSNIGGSICVNLLLLIDRTSSLFGKDGISDSLLKPMQSFLRNVSSDISTGTDEILFPEMSSSTYRVRGQGFT